MGLVRTSAKKLSNLSNSAVGGCLHLTDLESRTGNRLRFCVALLYLVLVAGAILVWRSISQRMHVLFWLGHLPQTTLLATTLALCASFLILTRVRITRHYRFQESRDDPNQKVAQVGRLRPFVGVSVILAIISMGLGGFMLAMGFSESAALADSCGTVVAPRSQQLERVSDRLVQFQKGCLKKREKVKSVTKCPGFNEEFSASADIVGYLMRLETNEGCTGFCSSTNSLVVEGGAGRSMEQHACADIVGQHVRHITWLVGLPSVIIGFALAVVAFSLFEYEGL